MKKALSAALLTVLVAFGFLVLLPGAALAVEVDVANETEFLGALRDPSVTAIHLTDSIVIPAPRSATASRRIHGISTSP